MPPEEPIPPHVKEAQNSMLLAGDVLFKIGLLTVGILLASIIGGLALDRFFDTKPLFTALLLVGSFPITFYIIYRVAISAVAKIPPPPRHSRPKEESSSDDNH